ncbi:hypothetical protein ADT71_12895 [Novosphingobium sp. ST904]|nr:hypothetical protein ADT71_12895 [Novosphingobium sp. ST904]TCM32409.1 hypothetical protein EDF59_124104 [Novosphingobium sp. ST904]
MKLRQGYGVDFVGFNTRISNCANQAGIGHDDSFDMRSHEPFHSRAITGHLDHDLVVKAERLGESHERHMGEFDAKFFSDLTTFQNRHLGERSMNIHANDFHTCSPLFGSQWLARHLRIRARSAAGQVVGAAM